MKAATRFPRLFLIALCISFCLALGPELMEAQRSIVRPPKPPKVYATLMSDSLYDTLSAMPLDSLSARHYDLLMRERTLRAEKDNPFGTGFMVGLGVIAALVLVGLLLSPH